MTTFVWRNKLRKINFQNKSLTRRSNTLLEYVEEELKVILFLRP